MNPQPTIYSTATALRGQDNAATGRRQLGLEIAATIKIGKNRAGYVVPSQSGTGSYLVNLDGEPFCTCPDFELRQEPCKHIFAVEFLVQREGAPRNPTKTDKGARESTTDRDWSAYNDAQANEGRLFPALLRELCDAVPQHPRSKGRPRLPLGDVLHAACTKVYSTRSTRRAMAEISDAKANGYLSKAPSVASVFRCIENPELTPVLQDLIAMSALPLRTTEVDFAIDASGFSSSVYENWHDHKWVRRGENTLWVKGHICCGVRSNIITAAVATPGTANDAPFFTPLLEATAPNFRVDSVSADKAYLSRKNLGVIEALGASARIPFKSNSAMSAAKKRRDPVWERNFRFFHDHRSEFLEGYHKRSNVETVFSMVKSRFGGSVRSKTPAARLNEVLLKFLCHNLCVVIKAKYDLGIEPDFDSGPREVNSWFPMAA